MIIIDEERASDSPFVERVWRSHSEGAKPFLSIAVNHSELVEAALQGEIKGLTQRAVQYRFLQATGIMQNAARQIERARYAPSSYSKASRYWTPLSRPGITINHI